VNEPAEIDQDMRLGVPHWGGAVQTRFGRRGPSNVRVAVTKSVGPTLGLPRKSLKGLPVYIQVAAPAWKPETRDKASRIADDLNRDRCTVLPEGEF